MYILKPTIFTTISKVEPITGGYKFYILVKLKLVLRGREMRYREGRVRISGDGIQKQTSLQSRDRTMVIKQ
jgi:hypothetical protein